MRNRFGACGSAWMGAILASVLFMTAEPIEGQIPADYTAPRSRVGDGKPDLSGIWQALNTANWDLLSRSPQPGPVHQLGAMFFVPPGRGVVDGDEIPYQPWAAERRRQNFENRLVTEPFNHDRGDPELKCYMPGIPRATYMPYPFQILHGEREILFVYQFAKASRVVHMAKRVELGVDTWMGISNGHWDGDTLVVEVTELNGLAWLDRAGNFTSRTAKIIERYTPISPYHLNYEVTIEDPNVFTRPWSMRMSLYRIIDQGAELLDANCVEFSEEALYGEIRKLTDF
jgi:hypothetical protein